MVKKIVDGAAYNRSSPRSFCVPCNLLFTKRTRSLHFFTCRTTRLSYCRLDPAWQKKKGSFGCWAEMTGAITNRSKVCMGQNYQPAISLWPAYDFVCSPCTVQSLLCFPRVAAPNHGGRWPVNFQWPPDGRVGCVGVLPQCAENFLQRELFCGWVDYKVDYKAGGILQSEMGTTAERRAIIDVIYV